MGAVAGQLLTYWDGRLGDSGVLLLTRIPLAALAVLGVWLLGRAARRAARRALDRARAHVNARLLIDRLIQFTVLLVAGAWVLSILGVQLTALVAVLGAGALAVSLALQDLLKNLVAGLYILVERPFALGDRIEFKAHSGVVENIAFRTTALRNNLGQRVMIPNAMLFSEALVNLSAYGRHAIRLRVSVPAAENGRRAEELVLRAARAALPDADDASVHLVKLGAEDVTVRVEGWAADAQRAISDVAWAVREALPNALIEVLD